MHLCRWVLTEAIKIRVCYRHNNICGHRHLLSCDINAFVLSVVVANTPCPFSACCMPVIVTGVHSASGSTQWLLVCLQVCTLYICIWVVPVHYMALLSNVKHDCKTVGIRMHFGGRGFTYWDQTARCLVPRLRVLGVTNVPWDHLSGPQTYINDVECNK